MAMGDEIGDQVIDGGSIGIREHLPAVLGKVVPADEAKDNRIFNIPSK